MSTLRKNDRGNEVKVLQFGIGTICDGMFGPNTAKALRDWHVSYAFPPTSEMTDEVSKTLLAQELEPCKHLRLASRFLFLREQDINQDGSPDNRSPLIDVMTKYVWNWWNPQADTIGAPWCAIFISYILFAAYGYEFKSAKVSEWKEHLAYAQDARIITSKSQFSKNHIYIGGWVKDSGYGHIFFVNPVESLKLNSNLLATLEGNTNDGGSRDGDGVYERERKFSDDLFLFSLPVNF